MSDDAVQAIIPPKWDAPVPATDDAYDVRVTVDGDELQLPFKIQLGKDYRLGEDLRGIGFTTAKTIYSYFPERYIGSVRVTIFPLVNCREETCAYDGCLEDHDPLPVADIAIER